MIPVLLLIIVFSYRYIKQKNTESEIHEQEVYFTELEKERQRIYEKMYGEQRIEEFEPATKLEQINVFQFASNPISTNKIDHEKQNIKNDHDDETDEEFFEMPLPPVPTVERENESLSITDNEGTLSPTPTISTSIFQETPKVNNIRRSFNFSPLESRRDKAEISTKTNLTCKSPLESDL